jgi:hypothetical protein
MARAPGFGTIAIVRDDLLRLWEASPLGRSERPRGAEGLLGEERSASLLSPHVQSCLSLCHLDGTPSAGF